MTTNSPGIMRALIESLVQQIRTQIDHCCGVRRVPKRFFGTGAGGERGSSAGAAVCSPLSSSSVLKELLFLSLSCSALHFTQRLAALLFGNGSMGKGRAGVLALTRLLRAIELRCYTGRNRYSCTTSANLPNCFESRREA